MGLIVHNTSMPDDGLGDALRKAFTDANTMNAELFSTKVTAVAGYGLSKNDFTDLLKAKLEGLATDTQKNVQSDWNELDPTSDAFILGKPIFESNEIIVSAIWKSGLIFDVSADAFPINNISYPANPAEVTLDAADGALDRIDLIVAIKPISPATVGEVGFIKGTPATTALVVPPDFDPSIYYVIKQVIVRAAATEPEGTSTTQIYNEGTEWGFVASANIAETENDPSVGIKCLEATNNNDSDNVLFTAPAPISTEELSLLTFDFKLKEEVLDKKIFIEVLLAGVRILKYGFGRGENGYFDQDLEYQTLSIDKSALNLPITNFDQIRIRPFFDSTGYFIDNFVLHTGSGSETVPESGIPEAPTDGKLYGRKNEAWSVAASFSDAVAGNILVSDGNEFKSVTMSGGATIASDGTITILGTQATTAVIINAKVDEAGGINKGQVVYLTGATGGTPTVALADKTDYAKSDIIAVATEDKANNQNITVTILGLVENVDTSAFSEGDIVYLGTAGDLTNMHPTGLDSVQRIGEVVRSNASTGSILISIDKLTIIDNIDGFVRHQVVNRSAGTSAVVNTTMVNDVGHYLSINMTGSNNNVMTPSEAALYSTGHGLFKFIQDGNKDFVWATDPTDSHNLSFVEKMRLTAAGLLRLQNLTASEIVITNATKDIVSAPVATYPSLSELAFLKGVTSAIQTQLNAKAAKFGTRVTDAAVTGAKNIDHNAGDDYKFTLTGNTTFSDTNLPTGTDTIEFTMRIKGAFVPTFPSYWEIVGDAYDGAVWNFYSVQVHIGTAASEEVTAFLTNLGA